MKILQEKSSKIELKALSQFEMSSFTPENPRKVILLLHGLAERGKRIFRKLSPYLPEDSIILAPNAPFPILKTSAIGQSLGYTWYFYDTQSGKYLHNQDMARDWLKELLKKFNPQGLPLIIIGFSQGGYLAPLVGSDHPNTELVIGLGCEFRNTLIQEKLHFPLIGLHGENDEILSPEASFKNFDMIKHLALWSHWESLPNTKHEINEKMGERVREILETFNAERSL